MRPSFNADIDRITAVQISSVTRRNPCRPIAPFSATRLRQFTSDADRPDETLKLWNFISSALSNQSPGLILDRQRFQGA
jgi:hypothetical protein